MAERKKFIVTSQEDITLGSTDANNRKMPQVTIVISSEASEPEPSQPPPSRFQTRRARIDSSSSNNSTDDEQDPSVRALEEPSYVDSITSTSSTASAKPLLSSVNEMEELHEEDLQDRLARSNTMKGLLENPSYLDSLTISSPTHKRLARACRKAVALRQKQELASNKSVANLFTDKDGKVIVSDKLDPIPKSGQVKKGTYVKNVVLLSVGAMLSYTAFLSLRNLQSSLNHEAGLGLISLSGGYGMFMLGSLISPFVVKALRPKRAILLAILMQMLYVAMNAYPSWYTLLPSTMITGMCNAFLWVAVNTYLTYLSTDYSKLSGKPLASVMSAFFGIYYMVFQMNNIFGNLLSSVILFSGQGWKEVSSNGIGNGTIGNMSSSTFSGDYTFMYTNKSVTGESHFQEIQLLHVSDYDELNDTSSYFTNGTYSFTFDPKTHCGANYCHSYPIDQSSGNLVTDHLRYILMGAFGTFALCGFLTILLFVEPLKTYNTKVQCVQALTEIKSVFRLMFTRKFLLLIPLQAYAGFEMSFLPGDVLKAFVTCPVGIQMVGYVMMGYGASTAISAYVSGRLHKLVGRLALLCTAGLINVSIFICLYNLKIEEGKFMPIMVMVACWGIADGIWNTQVNSCVATMFVKKSEQALAGNRFVTGFGVTLAYAYAPFFCMKVKLAFTASVCVFGVICFIILDLMQRRSDKKFKVTQV